MAREVFFDERVSFKLKEDHTLDDLVSDFCSFYEESNAWGGGSQVRKADLVSGQLTAVQVTREMFWGGRGVGLLLFYRTKDNAGGASLYILGDRQSIFWDRPVNRIREQFREFFSGECDDLVRVESQAPLGSREVWEAGIEDRVSSEQPPQALLTPLTYCERCGAAIAIDASTYCWNCGGKLLAHRMRERQYFGDRTQASTPQCDEVEYDRSCMICRLKLEEGQLVAWCPKCGAPAHRIHMLEWLHVKASCPACGQHLDSPELEKQLSQAHIRQPTPPKSIVGARKGRESTPAKRRIGNQRRQYQPPGRQGSSERRRLR